MQRLVKIFRAAGQLSTAARHYNTPFYFQAKRFQQLHNQWLFSLDDALFWGLTDPILPESALGSYLSREAAARLRGRVNGRGALVNVNNKARFYRLCEEAGLAIAQTFGVFVTGKARPSRTADPHMARITLASLPDGSFVTKPVWGMKGKGIWFFEKRGEAFTVGAQTLDAPSLGALLCAHADEDDFIVQRRVLAHPSLTAISGSQAVQSARMVTFLDAENQAHLLFARFKIVRQGNETDNFADGLSGNLIADVDLQTGKITKVLAKTPSRIGLQSVTTHPDTGKPLAFILPDWQQAVQLACEGARQFHETRSLGWDIALTPEGPVILEANQEWEIFPIAPYHKPAPLGEWESLIR